MSTEVESDHSPAAVSSRQPGPPDTLTRGAVLPVVAGPVTSESSGNAADRRIYLRLFFAAAAWCLLWSCASGFRWANFQYRTFDLAYYVQALWQFIHGRFALTVENVPLLGNHVEPIVFLLAPIFAVVRHPMTLVVVQNAAVAGMAPIGYLIARRWFEPRTSARLSLALLLAPATNFVALHEFHPEALAAPLLLLLVYARSTGKLWLHWISFFAVLACKENMALLLGAYCLVFLVIERSRGRAVLLPWSAVPLVVALSWFVICTRLITPALNSGTIDYLSLYDRLGKNTGEIVWNAITRPQLIGRALSESLGQGNLVWGLLLPFGLLPLLRPRWLLIAAPIFLQHLLSWRSSEWSIYFHYAAPLLPLVWISAVEALAMLQKRWQFRGPTVAAAATALLIACVTAQIWTGSASAIWSDLQSYSGLSADRARKQAFVSRIPASASVVAPLPYLSHLAMRQQLYSLHYILKGLKTLSHESYEPPPPTEFVLIDYNDSATFDPSAGYYHPAMQTMDGRVVPSSDQLLHNFLAKASWSVEATNELTLFRRTAPRGESGDVANHSAGDEVTLFHAAGNDLTSVRFDPSGGLVSGDRRLQVDFHWKVDESRKVFPWMLMALGREGQSSLEHFFVKGLCAIEVNDGTVTERWTVDLSGIPPGSYRAEATFLDYPKVAHLRSNPDVTTESGLLQSSIPLGGIVIPSHFP